MKLNFNDFLNKGSNLSKDINKLNDTKKSDYSDDRIVKPSTAKDIGSSHVLKVRLLPSMHVCEKYVDENGDPISFHFVKKFHHFYYVGTNKFFGLCRKQTAWRNNLDREECPSCDRHKYPGKEYSQQSPEKASYDRRKHKQNILFNCLCIEDSNDPSNNGKNKIIELNNSKALGQVVEKKLFGMKDKDGNSIVKGNPDIIGIGDDQYIITITSIRTGEREVDYNVEFEKAPHITNGDMDALKTIMENTFDLYEFIDMDKYPTYEELNTELDKIFGTDFQQGKNNQDKFNNELESKVNESEEEEDLPTYESVDSKEESDKVKFNNKNLEDTKESSSDAFDYKNFINN